MELKHLSLQNFRSYLKSEFKFSPKMTFVVGPNTVGKTNLIEAIYFLSSGKSFRAEKDFQTINFDKDLARIKGEVDDTQLEVVIARGEFQGRGNQIKKFLVNGVAKRKIDFMGNFYVVLFSPVDLDIIVDSPSLRRNFLNEVLEQVDKDYRFSLTLYEKSLRQRNALLERAKETGRRSEKEFEYWDNILIKNGEIIAQKREDFFEFLNTSGKDIFDFAAFYDKSVISKERLLQYKEAETGSGLTLVGPHRDDFNVQIFNNDRRTTHDVKFFGSRGQQRLIVLQLKLLQLDYVEKKTGQRPVFLLDDIFSELDKEHIELVSEMIGRQQTIITTTHKEFIGNSKLKGMDVIELEL